MLNKRFKAYLASQNYQLPQIRMKYFIALLLLFITIGAYAQSNWKLKRDDDGIKVFVGSSEHSDFKAIRVECVARATLSQFTGLLLDAERAHDWVSVTPFSAIISMAC